MALTNEEKKYYESAQVEISATANFMKRYQTARAQTGVTTVDAYDSCHSAGEKEGNLEEVIPQTLVDIFDSIHPDGKPYVLAAIEAGIEGYKANNGGEMPRADMLAAGLSEGLVAAKTFDHYDSANGTQLNAAGMESNAVVPSATVVAISSRIANALPLIAYLPNSNGSNVVPIIYGRNVAKNTYGEVKAGDYLDGPSASLQYFDPQFEFEATQDLVDLKKYKLTPTVAYADNEKRTPNPTAKALPFIGGRVRIYVNGVEVGNDATVNHAKFKGESAIIPVPGHKLTLKDAGGDVIDVKLASGIANLDNGTIEVVFVEELPAGANVTVNIIGDYEAKDPDGKPLLTVPSLDIDLIARQVFAYPMRAIYRVTREAAGQMQRELNVDMRGGVTAVVANKYALEQNIRLLKAAKRRAVGFGRVLTADLSRGATDTAVFNNTSEQARELLVTISSSKVLINKLLDITPAGHDIFVTDKMSVLFDNLADDTHYRKIASAVGAPNQIVRIGSIDGNINVYHVPADSGLLKEVNDAAEIMIIGRGGEAVRNPFVGFVTTPLTVRESNAVDFEDGVTIQGSQASELNPLERFADQVVVINVTNLPLSVVGA
jgi:hypothetical protein